MKHIFRTIFKSFSIFCLFFCGSCGKKQIEPDVENGLFNCCSQIKDTDFEFDTKILEFDYANYVVLVGEESEIYYEIFVHYFVDNANINIVVFYFLCSTNGYTTINTDKDNYYFVRWSIANNEMNGYFGKILF